MVLGVACRWFSLAELEWSVRQARRRSNPPERDELLAQRTKDLQGLIGQLRGFSLEEFLGEEEPGKVIPWSLLSDVESAIEPKDLVTGKTVRPRSRIRAQGAGIRSLPTLSVLFRAFGRFRRYSGPEGALRAGLLHERMLKTTELSKFCPAAYRLPGCEPPFEDLEGTGLHFEKQGKARLDG